MLGLHSGVLEGVALRPDAALGGGNGRLIGLVAQKGRGLTRP
jgi:hypothetical protein